MTNDYLLRFVNWNARSLANKKTDLEQLIYLYQPHIICITETWFNEKVNFSIYDYNIYRKDRPNGRGGGVAIMVKREILTSALEIKLSDPGMFCSTDYIGIRIKTIRGTLELVTIYSPIGAEPETQDWQELVGSTEPGVSRITCGDFNAHSCSWGSNKSSCRGNRLALAVEGLDMIPINDGVPTHISTLDRAKGNLDLVFVPTNVAPYCTFEVSNDSFSSDHLPVVFDILLRPSNSPPSAHRINTERVNWSDFRWNLGQAMNNEPLNAKTLPPDLRYKNIMEEILQKLIEHGAFIPGEKKGKRKSQPLWWNPECEKLVAIRREARKKYLDNQTLENLQDYKRINNKVKRDIRELKTKSFDDFCDNLDITSGSSNIWKTVKNMISRSRSGSVNVYTDPNSTVQKDMQNALVREDVEPVIFVPMEVTTLEDGRTANSRFTMTEFKVALDSCNLKSSPGLDGISYKMIKNFPNVIQEEFLDIFNEMFEAGTYPESWRDTLVKFIPKGGGGHRPISLTSCVTKLFERLIQGRLEYLAETLGWVPDFQFGFRRGRSSLDAVALLVTDIYRAFGERKNLMALALDIKGAFNSIRPGKVIEELITLDAPTRIINFVGFLISARNLYFSTKEEGPRKSGIGVPQGGVLSPFLFSVTLRKIADQLPRNVKIIMYADDVIIYAIGYEITELSNMLKEAFGNIKDWLINLGLEISVEKTQLTVFTRIRAESRKQHSITLGDQILQGSGVMKYLGIYLDQGLRWHPHINSLVVKANKTMNVLKVLARVSHGPSSSALLTVTKAMIITTLIRSFF